MGKLVYNLFKINIKVTNFRCKIPGKSFIINRTQSDTGRLVEYTKALKRMIFKELGKMTL